MNRSVLLQASLAVSVFASVIAACSAQPVATLAQPDDPGGEPRRPPGGNDAGTTGGGPNDCKSGASSGLAPTDPNTLPKCACKTGGAARCVPKDKLPASLVPQLEACTEGGPGACVPDSLVKSGGATPKKCESPFGEGRCMDICIPEIGKNAAALNRGTGDVCAESERCAPCLNPLKNNEPSGVCDIGATPAASDCEPPTTTTPTDGGTKPPQNIACPYTGPALIDVNTFPSCADGAHCIPESLAGSAASQLAKCTGAGGGLCAPDKSIAAGGQYLPKTCKAVGDGEGRCINLAIPAVAAQKAQLTKDICDANELCAPCYDPTSGKDTGVCKTVSCDAPKEPAKLFKPCCLSKGTSRAKCVPATIIPATQQKTLDDDDGTCVKDKELCVPNEMLQPTFKGGPPCTAKAIQGKYTGVCLSDCLHFSFFQKLGTDQGSCINEYTCVPCEQGGKPTGAPGCPATPAPK